METSTNEQRLTTTRRNFPSKLYTMLQQMELEGHDDIIFWQPNGRSFLVHNVKEFEEIILPRFFRHTRMASFQRQLNIYDFNRITGGNDQHAYYHKYFVRGQPEQVSRILRIPTKGRKIPPMSYGSGTSVTVASDSPTVAASNVNHANVVGRINMPPTTTTPNAPSILRRQQVLSLDRQQTSMDDILLMNNIIAGVVREPHTGVLNHQNNLPLTRTSNNIVSSLIEPFISSILQNDTNISTLGNQLMTLQAIQRLSLPNPLLSNVLSANQQSCLRSILLLLSSLLLNNNDETVRRNLFIAILRIIDQQQYTNGIGNTDGNNNINNNNDTTNFLTIFGALVQNTINVNNTNFDNNTLSSLLLRSMQQSNVQNRTLLHNTLVNHPIMSIVRQNRNNNSSNNNINNNNSQRYPLVMSHHHNDPAVLPILSNIQELSRIDTPQDTFRHYRQQQK